MAEDWAKLHNIPFPTIDRTLYEREGMKDYYVFYDEGKPRCPIIIHIPIASVKFKTHFVFVENVKENFCSKKIDMFKDNFRFIVLDHCLLIV